MKSARGHEFVFQDGTKVLTIKQLIKHVKDMSPEQYVFHVNDWKNDFYNWIKECISPEVASSIEGNVSQRDLIERLTGHHWHYNHKKKYNY